MKIFIDKNSGPRAAIYFEKIKAALSAFYKKPHRQK